MYRQHLCIQEGLPIDCHECRVPAKMDLVRELSIDSILYMPGPEVVTETTDISRGASLNRVLRKIYPRGTEPKVTDLVAFLDDDQVCHI